MNTPELIQQLVANFFVASLVFYFLSQRVTDLKADKANLEAKITKLEAQHEDDLQKQIRRRNGDTGRIPELPASEVEKFKKSIGE